MDHDVPFISSGALSRAQYAVVRAVESAPSTPAADQRIVAEVETIRRALSRPFSPRECRECLVRLLYCASVASPSILPASSFEFALRHAVGLAETGRGVQDKRIAYLFCTDLLPTSHSLQLMLVNTLRKDLESNHMATICIALDTLISAPPPDVLPAVDARVLALTAHISSHVQRRALLCVRSLARLDPTFLLRMESTLHEHLRSPDVAVVRAALTVCSTLLQEHPKTREIYQGPLNVLLNDTWRRVLDGTDKADVLTLTRVLPVLAVAGTTEESCKTALEIVRYTASHDALPLLRPAITLLSQSPTSTLLALQLTQRRLAPVRNIRHLLSRGPNDQYIFLACLGMLDPVLWAGGGPEGARPLLEEWEMSRMLALVDAGDPAIRRSTLRVLARVDASIVQGYFASALVAPLPYRTGERDAHARRTLEIACVLGAEAYARGVLDVLARVDPGDVLEGVMEDVLGTIRSGSEGFRSTAVPLLVQPLAEDIPLGSTAAVLAAALAVEHGVPAPVEAVKGMARRLDSYAPAVQDALLLSMLCLSAGVDSILPEVGDAVRELETRAGTGRYIRRRCEQFLRLGGQGLVLKRIVSRARTSALPDFLEALTVHEIAVARARSPRTSSRASASTSSGTPSSPSHSHTSPSLAASKLRYAAYDAPKATARRARRPSSTLSSRSASSRGDEDLSRTVTAGDLALGAGEIFEMDKIKKSGGRAKEKIKTEVDEVASRVDLIAFDSPFMSDPPVSAPAPMPPSPGQRDPGQAFEDTWNDLEGSNSRGWCELSVDNALEKLDTLADAYAREVIAVELPPFAGELKILFTRLEGDEGVDQLSSTGRKAEGALRLKESEDESCLWRLRCADVELQTRVKRLLMES